MSSLSPGSCEEADPDSSLLRSSYFSFFIDYFWLSYHSCGASCCSTLTIVQMWVSSSIAFVFKNGTYIRFPYSQTVIPPPNVSVCLLCKIFEISFGKWPPVFLSWLYRGAEIYSLWQRGSRYSSMSVNCVSISWFLIAFSVFNYL